MTRRRQALLAVGRLPAPLRRARMRPIVRRGSHVLGALDRTLQRRTGRTIGGWIAGGAPVLVLTTTGRRSGQPRAVPLLYHREPDGSLLLIAANGTADWDPDWLHNLRADRRYTVEVEGATWPGRAEELSGPARDDGWRALRTTLPGADAAARACRREIAVVRLRRASSGEA